MSNDRQSELSRMNFKISYERKSQVLREALSELSQNLFGLDSPDSYLEKAQLKMQRDCIFARAVVGEKKLSYEEIKRLLDIIETRAELKDWNTPLQLLGR
jgi:hypothetical protein